MSVKNSSRFTACGAALLVMLLISFSTAHDASSRSVQTGSSKPTQTNEKPFAKRNGSHDIDAGGHKLHMIVQGSGKPIVILESGLGQGREAWTRVFLDIATFARVVTYDRAGLGQSEPGPKPR